MENEIRNHNYNDMTNVWKDQPVESVEISLAEICRMANKFEKRIFRRNLREYVAGAIVIASFGYYISAFHSLLTRTGCVLVIAGILFVAFALHKRGATHAVPADLAFRTCVEFHRNELQRQRDLLRGVWSWYLLPLVPGLFVFQAGLLEQALKQPVALSHAGAIVTPFAIALGGSAIVFVGIGSLNQWAARKLQRKIDELDGMEKES
jgi:hypothetical protein